jgi:hypothetical protein
MRLVLGFLGDLLSKELKHNGKARKVSRKALFDAYFNDGQDRPTKYARTTLKTHYDNYKAIVEVYGKDQLVEWARKQGKSATFGGFARHFYDELN